MAGCGCGLDSNSRICEKELIREIFILSTI